MSFTSSRIKVNNKGFNFVSSAILVLLMCLLCKSLSSGWFNVDNKNDSYSTRHSLMNNKSAKTHRGKNYNYHGVKSITDESLQLGAIIILTDDWKSHRYRKCYLNASLDTLAEKWRPHNPYPIILMDTKPWTRLDKVTIKRKWKTLDIKFLNIGSVFNSMPTIPLSSFEDAAAPLSNIGYKRMCHFFFKGFLDVPELMHYKYLMRMDDDTCILDHINYDLFQLLDKKKIAYAYNAIWYDGSHVTKGMHGFVRNYLSKNNIGFKNMAMVNATWGLEPAVASFNTNFELINTVRYRDDETMKFVQAVVDSNHIFHRRWGDAPLSSMVAEVCWTEQEIMKLDDFEILHSTWQVMQLPEYKARHDPYVTLN